MQVLDRTGVGTLWSICKAKFALADHTHSWSQISGVPTATTTQSGIMSAADKAKLNGIASGANNYSLPTATSSVLGGVKTGSNITNSSGTISLSSSNVTSALGYTPVKNESGVASIRVMTQSAYDSLSSKSATTLYIITG